MQVASGTVCIVDAYSTGADLPWRFRSAGWQVVHVASPTDAPELTRTYDGRHVDQEITLSSERDLDITIDSLRSAGVGHVVAGTETGIELTDRLSAGLGLAGNDPESSCLRRVKTSMHERLRSAGLDYTRGCAIGVDELDRARSIVTPPCVVKPEASAGADDVYFCADWQATAAAVERIVGTTNKIGATNRRALVQEMLQGTQYFVNAMTVGGQTRILEIWKDGKLRTGDGRVVCDREELLPGTGDVQERIGNYLLGVLDALEIVDGPSHSELMVDGDRIVLIETAARMQGTILPEAVEAALGYSHPSAVVEATVDPSTFLARHSGRYTLDKHLRVVTLIAREEGLIRSVNVEARLNELESFAGVIHVPEVGEYLPRTVDLFTNPGTIYLCSVSTAVLDRDYATIREWEASGALFDLDR